MGSSTTKRPYFLELNNGLASISNIQQTSSISRPLYSPRKTNLSSFSSSSRSGKFLHGRFEEQPPHFLDACFLCKTPLGHNRDIFMYRGDTPFCSEDCRAEQIEIDETKQKNKNLSASMRALRKKEQSESSASKTSQNYPFHSAAVVAA